MLINAVAGAGELLGLAVVPGAAQTGGGQLLGGRGGQRVNKS